MQSRPGADMPSYANLEDRVIRVFISSTFSDMGAERDVLVKSVFPRLAAVAAKRDVTVVPLDLRWGSLSVPYIWHFPAMAGSAWGRRISPDIPISAGEP